ncbi:MAG: N,N-dimethylformamidase beta subunit family domain-containing protein [Terriglobales bacterium]
MNPNDHFRGLLRLASALLIAASVLIVFSAAAHASCSSPANAIEAENCLPGTPQSQWDISGAGDPSIQGFATDISFNVGQTVSFKINTSATAYHLDIYRMGYYQGTGARLIVGKALNNAILPSVTLPQTQPACVTDTTTNLVDCGNWAVSASWAVPATATSGIYFAELVRDDTVGTSHIVFIVRNDSSTSAVLFQTSDETWQAYNDFGGHSLYGPTGVFNNTQRAYKVSYNRPFHTRSLEPASWVFYAEYPMVRWLEANGYDVTYFTSLDAARTGSAILKHKLYLAAGHDEYWSGPKRTNIQAARTAGVNLGFFTGSGGFWKTRWENSIDGTSTAYRTLVSYKETLGETKIDPLDPPTWTGTWRDPTFSPPADGGNPENAVTGTLFRVSGCGADNTDLSMQVPAADGQMRFWRNTAIASQTTGQTFALPAGTLGYEWDVDADNGFRPAGLFPLSTATYNLTTDYLIDYGATYGAGAATHHSTLYRAASKALVFGAGTVQWSWGLDSTHDTYCGSGPYVTDPNMQQATVNLFADMGVQPATLQAGLLAASASADTTPPVSTITSPASGANVEPGSTVTIQGTAADSGGGVVGGVEVSTDGGTTWHPAIGRASWSYTWTVSGTGAATLRSRAVDDSGNLETPAAGVSINIAPPSCPCSIWASTTTPGTVDSGDPNPYELGVKFTADFNGTVTGIRFYKSAANTGTHIGNLWSAAGTLLNTATFTSESASGWQQVSFATPVAVTANTVYVASYSTTVGHYSFDSNYFATAGVDNPPLHALQNGVSGGDGILATTPGVFPSSTFSSANYWVDLVYVPTSTTTLVSIAVTPANPTLQITNTQPFTATGTYSDGSTANITSQVTWTSSNTGVASINSTGLATAVAGGSANMIATLGNTSGSSTVTVPAALLAVTTTTLPNAAVDVPYSATLAATGGVQPYTWSLAAGSSLPAGLTLSPAGQITGTLVTAATSTFTVQVKDSGVLEGAVNPPQTATGTVSITTTIPAFFTIWPSTAAPVTADAGDASAVELGVRFQADTGGLITGIRFYKSAANTGTHVGNLWTNTGSLLATATFASETASGWQQVSLSSPVAIAANTPYVASYHTTVGHYSSDANYFATAGVNSPPLHALQNGVSGANGVFTYDITAGCTPTVQPCFPATTFNSANYWVDVVFQNTFGISGTISGAGGNGATVTASLNGTTVATATANAAGAYTLAGLGDGTYTVTPTNAGYTFSPASQSVTITNGSGTANFSSLYSITGTISGTGGNGATVTLSGAATATVIASASGAYTFTGLASGAYTVTPSNTGFTFSPASKAITISKANVTANFSTLFSLSGTISPAPSGGYATVAVTGTATATVTAGANGTYTFTGLPSGTYTVTATKPGFSFSPTSQSASSTGAPVTGINFTAAVSIGMDATATADSSTASTSITTATFSTKAANELLLAFVATHGTSASVTVSGVTGAGLTWALVQRTNAQRGTAEIWRAFAPSTLASVSVTATLSRSVAASITVVSYAGVNPSGTNGSGAIGATGTGSADPGAPTASLVTTQNNSWVFGVGNDVTAATARTLGPNQTMVHQYVGTADTFWVQSQSSATPLSGTTVTINDTAPTADRYNLSLCEILPAPTPWVLSGTISGGGAGATVKLSGPASATVTADASGNYSFTGLTSGTYAVTPSNTGFKYTPASQTVTVNGANLPGVNFTGVATYNISGSISPAALASGATVTLSGPATATTTADASGNYTFTGLLNGAYTVTPSKTGFTFTPANLAATINSATLTGVNFSVVTYSVAGTISGPGGSGAIVTATGAVSASATADTSGNYTLTGLANGAYTVTPSNPTFAFTPAGLSVTVASANVTGMNFSSTATYGVAGTISGPGGNGATVSLAGAATVAGSSNMVLYSQFDSGTLPRSGPWIYFGCDATFTSNTSDLTDPNGGSTALKMANPASTSCGSSYSSGVQQTVAGVTLNGTYTVSVWARGAAGGETFKIGMSASNGCTETPLTTSWVRYTCTINSLSNTAYGFEVWTNTPSATIYLWGAQLEPRSTVGTYVHTTSAPMTLVTADASGNYSFTGLVNGAYMVAPSNTGTTYTPASQPATVNNASVTALNFSTVTYSISGTISGTGGNAATVNLTGPATATATADASGNYTFSGLVNGAYTVTPSHIGFNFTPASQSATVNSANVTALNFSTVTYTLSGTISGAGGNGATVNLSGAATATTTADASGNYTFSGLTNGAYTVTPSNTGFNFTPASQTVTLTTANVTAVNFSTTTYTISGMISGPGGSGATVNLTGASTAAVTADASGNYTFTGLANGAYTVTPSKTGVAYTPASQPATISNANVTALNFSTVTYSISGTISGTGGNAATVNLTGTATATATADASGNYTFSGLVNGPYTITPSKTGFTFTPPNQAVTVASASITGVNFTAVAPTTFSVSGTISGSGGNAAAVTLSGTASATTAADTSGNYTFSNLNNGSYTVTPSKAGFVFTPVNKAVTVSGASVTAVNFVATSQLAIDQSVSTDRSTSSTTITSPTFTTTKTNELLLAFVASDGNTAGITVTGVANATGTALTWTLVKRTNTQLGTAEIWRAFSPTALSGASVKATLSQSVAASITVVTFSGVDPSGTGGSGAIGATGGGTANPGAPTASLTTTRDNSWVIGVGSDWDNATSRTVGANQTMVHQYLATIGDTYWVQRQTSTTPASGTVVTINDTAPTGDLYNLSICEVLPAP